MDNLTVLSGSLLFDMLSNQELEAVAALALTRQFEAGEAVFLEGELGDSLYVIAQGEVDVVRGEAVGTSRALATLGPPQFFGEMSLIDKEYRSATARARTDCTLLQLTAERLTTFRRQHRDGFTFIIINIARTLSARLREANLRGART